MRALVTLTLMLLLALTALAATVRAGESAPPAYLVIVHPESPLDSLNRRFLADAFLKKVTRWPDQSVIQPADLSPRSATREAFSKKVLKRSVAAVKAYWQQRIFSGRGVPPPQFGSEESVVTYVLEHQGAVGYVSDETDLKGAKAVEVSW